MCCRILSLLVAWFLVAFFTTDFGRGWCHQKLQAFKFQKAVRNHIRLNALKCDDGCLLDVFRLEPAMGLIGRTEHLFLKLEWNGTAVKWSGV
jgi:hypothetical protein